MEQTTSPTTSPTAPPTGDAGPRWMKRVPLITGALAALAGYLTVHGADLSNNAIYQSNQAVLMQARASDKWNEYQADSVKAHVDDAVAATLPPGGSAAGHRLATEAADMRGRQPTLRADAEQLERDREGLLANGKRKLAEKAWGDFAGVAAQLGIALASVAALTRRPAAFTAGVMAGLAAVGMTVYSLVLHFVLK